MAKFHQENKFYRAFVCKAISCRRYKVQFIDYGNLINLMMYNLMDHTSASSGSYQPAVLRTVRSDAATTSSRCWYLAMIDCPENSLLGANQVFDFQDPTVPTMTTGAMLPWAADVLPAQ
ncbi:uncharacterized protein LOC119771166 isoform X2 [Culex quinquefasciatus]|uniref:uncharacterized protein LOC119771166 isoform X2 n=1 Tax=Culex quinquefasciatus TaxID=7176 RepID=UPI0018E349A2|nr:uncharacterized protein LOC119771166 isoform X2 [Culex quinquefasciatus]